MRKTLLGLLALTVAVPALPSAAAAQNHRDGGRYEQDYRGDRGDYRQDRREYRRENRRNSRRYARYYDDRGYYSGPTWRENGRYRCRRADGTAGLLIGGVAGALVGRSIDTRGDRTTGTLLGAALGAVIGNEVGRDDNRGRGRRCR